MRRVGLSGTVAVAIIAAAFALDAWVSLPAYSYLLSPGFAVVGFLNRQGVITAFDSSGDLSLAGVIAALVVNLFAWSFAVWLIAHLVVRYRRPAPSN